MKLSLKNKNAVITGASSGIGRAAAKNFAQRGTNVVLASRNSEKLKELQEELGTYNIKTLVIETDVRKLKDCRNLLLESSEKLGGIDIIVNNAGFTRRGILKNLPIKDLDRTIDVNLRATIRLSKLVIPYLMKRGGGRIINISSILGIMPIPTESVYSATKFAIRGFSYALAEELKDTGITVSVVSPGPVNTTFIMNDIESLNDIVLSSPLSSADDIAKLIVMSAEDGKMERIKPPHTGILAKIGFLFPSISKIASPFMESQGRKKKKKLLNIQNK